MYCIARPKNGISLNGDEYAVEPETGKVAGFETYEEARLMLMLRGYDEADMEREGIYIKNMDDEE